MIIDNKSRVFAAILASPPPLWRVSGGTFAVIAVYMGMLFGVLGTGRTTPMAMPKARRNLVVTLLDLPKSMDPVVRSSAHTGSAHTGTVEPLAAMVSDPRRGAAATSITKTTKLKPKDDVLATDPAQAARPTTAEPTLQPSASAPSVPAQTQANTAFGVSGEKGIASGGSPDGAIQGTTRSTGAGEGVGTGSGTGTGVTGGSMTVLPFMDGMSRPKLVNMVEPQYTREARDANVKGLFLAKCVITTTGALTRCRIVKGVPMMDQAVLSAISHWRYTPVVYQGKPVAVDYVIQVRLAGH